METGKQRSGDNGKHVAVPHAHEVKEATVSQCGYVQGGMDTGIPVSNGFCCAREDTATGRRVYSDTGCQVQ
jgi:hypothetical protein